MKREYDGTPIDMAWDSGPWANDGETIDATNSETGQIQTTMSNPEQTQISSPSDVPVATADAIRKALLNGKTAQTLSENYPYSAAGVSQIAKRNEVVDGTPTQPKCEWRNNQVGWVEDTDGKSEKEIRDSKPAQAKYIRSRLLDGSTYSELEDEGFSPGLLRDAANGNGDFEDVNCEISPLEYKGGGNTPNWVEKNPSESAPGQRVLSDNQVSKIRKRLIEGDSCRKIARELGIAKNPVTDAAKAVNGYSNIDVEPGELEYTENDEWVLRDEQKDNNKTELNNDLNPESEPTLDGQTVSKQPSTDSMNYYKVGAVIALVYATYRLIRGVLQ